MTLIGGSRRRGGIRRRGRGVVPARSAPQPSELEQLLRQAAVRLQPEFGFSNAGTEPGVSVTPSGADIITMPGAVEFLHRPGGVSTFAFKTGMPNLNTAGTIDWFVRLSLQDWTATNTLFARSNAANVTIQTDGTVRLTLINAAISSFECDFPAPGFLDDLDDPVWMHFSIDTTTGAAVARYSTDQAALPEDVQNWVTHQGALTATIGGGPWVGPTRSNTELDIGSGTSGGGNETRRIYHFREALNGTTNFDWNLHRDGHAADKSTATAGTGGSVSLFRPASPNAQLLLVERPGFVFGANQYIGLSDHATWDLGTSDEGSLVVAFEYQRAHLASAHIFDATDGSSLNGFRLYMNTTANQILGAVADASGAATSAAVATLLGRPNVASLRISSTDLTLRCNGTEATPVARPGGAVTVGQSPRIGSETGGTTFEFSGLVFGAWWFPGTVLSDDDVDLIEAAFGV